MWGGMLPTLGVRVHQLEGRVRFGVGLWGSSIGKMLGLALNA